MTAITGTNSTSELEGRVSRVNATGVLLAGQQWRTVSKFSGGVLLPAPGERVRLVLDAAGFIRRVEALAPSVSTGEAAAVPVETQPHTPPDRETPSESGHSPEPPARSLGTQTTRLACLTTATAICTAGGRVPDLAAVLATAAELERWVTR
jgi:hypothetical protein